MKTWKKGEERRIAGTLTSYLHIHTLLCKYIQKKALHGFLTSGL